MIQRMGIDLVSKYWYCTNSKQETMTHILVTVPIAFKIWILELSLHVQLLPVCSYVMNHKILQCKVLSYMINYYWNNQNMGKM